MRLQQYGKNTEKNTEHLYVLIVGSRRCGFTGWLYLLHHSLDIPSFRMTKHAILSRVPFQLLAERRL